jgi:flagellin
MLAINTNVSATIAHNALRTNARSANTAMSRLATGTRINSGDGDGSGMGMSTKMESASRVAMQGMRNVNDAISMLQTFDAAGRKILEMVVRMEGLVVQAQTDTLQPTDREALNQEFFQMLTAWSNIAATTSWNGQALMATNQASGTFTVGLDATSQMQIVMRDWRPISNQADAATQTSVNGFASPAAGRFYDLILSKTDSNGVANQIAGDNVLYAADINQMALKVAQSHNNILMELNRMGAYTSALQIIADDFSNIAMATKKSQSQISDADYASETAALSRTQIISKASTAMLAQANVLKNDVMTLLN